MSTPIETVREFINRHGTPPNGPHDELGVALAHVLRDAERFQSLEAFMEDAPELTWPGIERAKDYCAYLQDEEVCVAPTLAELADRMRNEGAK